MWPLSAAQTKMTPWPWVVVHAIQICMALAEAWPSHTNMSLGGSPGSGWQHEPWMSTQTLTVVGHGTPDIVFVSSQARMSAWTQVVVQLTQIGLPGPGTPIWPQMAAEILGMHSALIGNRSHEH